MNTQQLRQSLRQQWLDYYRANRDWIARLGIWVTCQGQRRPSSSFILASLTLIEPKLTQLMPLVVDLSSNPDRIVVALGLNFNPDEALENLPEGQQSDNPKMLPASAAPEVPTVATPSIPVKAPIKTLDKMDESCEGIRDSHDRR